MSIVELDPFARFRLATRARIGLGRCGDGIPTTANLELQLAHARARDAVHGAVDFAAMAQRLAPRETVRVRSRCESRTQYLARPDLGRRLEPADAARLEGGPFDVVFVLGDGLSAAAIEHHAEAALGACLNRLGDLKVGPVVLAEQARVALGDEIGEGLQARAVVILIGERPGLSAPDSLGAYVTHAPKVGRMDSERNCVSNIHLDGLTYEGAADRIAWLLREAFRLGLTGVGLKENAGSAAQLPTASAPE
ncbi:ethanolamine ammonia-lyase subunit EutC [Phenylobacterium sp. LjRoot225]|uniref:ethanolamine ammonia-lyase subunit EutC n=1 Tax=Phenylobacterium sp. LjRoot225 TaxID=3342285 RepID=UPI003ECC460E